MILQAALFSLLAHAAPAPSLESVLASADAAVPTILAARADRDGARAARLSAGGWFDPRADVDAHWRTGPYEGWTTDVSLSQTTPLWGARIEAGWRIGQGAFPVYEGKLDTLGRGEVRLGLELPLLEGGLADRGRTGLRTARARVDAAEAALDRARIDVARDARIAWWRWVAAGARVRTLTALRELADDRVDAVQRRVAAGDRPAIDLVEARRIAVDRQAREVGALRDLAAEAFTLGLYLRDGSGRPAPPLDAQPPPPPMPADVPALNEDVLLDAALARRPEVASLRAALEATEAELALARVDLLPQLDVGASIQQDLPAAGDTAEPVDIRVGGRLAFTFGERGDRGAFGQARSARDAVNADLTWAADRIAAQVRTAVTTRRAAHERARLADQREALAIEVELATERRFELGDTDLLDVWVREQARLEASLARIDAWTAYHVAAADLIASLGLREELPR